MKPSSTAADMTKGSPVRLILTFSICDYDSDHVRFWKKYRRSLCERNRRY